MTRNSTKPYILGERPIRVLLADDDEDDYLIIRNMLAESLLIQLKLDWASYFEEAMKMAEAHVYDVFLCDYRFEKHTGIELMQQLHRNGQKAPVIILTGKGTQDIDFQVMKAGADDYLEKSSLTANILERSIRYAIERRKTMEKLEVSEKRLQTLSAKLVAVQENERKLVSQDLHDSIGASLAAIKFALEAKLADMNKGRTPAVDITLEHIIAMVRDTIEETHRISTNLRPSILDDMGILKTIAWVCRKTQEVYTDLKIEKQFDLREGDVPEPLKIVICRIVQEALNNAAKHSNARTIQVLLKKIKNNLKLGIEDNGRGFDSEAVCNLENGGMGLMNMRERTELSGGTIRITSEDGKGTRIRAIWPLK
jgi:signal transduction histidine kinase